jgi:hypothetical protein
MGRRIRKQVSGFGFQVSGRRERKAERRERRARSRRERRAVVVQFWMMGGLGFGLGWA